MQLLTFLIWTSAVAVSSSSAKRNIQIKGHDFVDSMGSKIVLAGPNVVRTRLGVVSLTHYQETSNRYARAVFLK